VVAPTVPSWNRLQWQLGSATGFSVAPAGKDKPATSLRYSAGREALQAIFGNSLGRFPGIVTRPGFSGCLYCRWLPLVATRIHPSDSMPGRVDAWAELSAQLQTEGSFIGRPDHGGGNMPALDGPSRRAQRVALGNAGRFGDSGAGKAVRSVSLAHGPLARVSPYGPSPRAHQPRRIERGGSSREADW
jgi:hypothetical protein